MDTFVSTVSSQIIYLDGLDASCSIIGIPFCYWYKNSAKGCWNVFMPPGILEHAFYMTLQEFPIICGYIKADTNSRTYVEVDKDNLNIPLYTDTCCDLDYLTMQESGFNIDKLPVDLNEEFGVPAPPGLVGGQIKLGYFRVIRFRDNSGVVVCASMAHCLVDGYGFTHFMNRWAEISRWAQQPQDVSNNAPLLTCRYTHDRSIHANYRSRQTTALDTFTLDALSTGNIFTKWLSWVSPETRGRLFRALSGAASRTCCYFQISLKTLEDLRTAVQRHIPQETRCSINDIITAYVTIVVVQAKERASADWWNKPVPSAIRTIFGNDLGKHTGFLTGIAVNMRPHISHTDAGNYMGNMSFGKCIWFPQELVQVEPTEKALSALALRVRQAVIDVDEQYVAQFGHLLESEPDSYMRLLFCSAKHRRKLIISSQVRFAHYNVDFGAGSPALVRLAPCAFPDVAFVMPGNPTIGGYEIALNLAPDVALYLIQNASWMKLVDNYDCYL